MLTYVCNRGTRIQYNSDLSGDVIVNLNGAGTTIPAADVLEFVARCYVAYKRLEEIANSSIEDLLR